ncbi:unnamed protein product [Eretmochelys imbricata]
MVQAVRRGAYWHTPSCAASKGSDMTGSSFISVWEVFRKTFPGCRSSTRTSSRLGNCFLTTRSVAATEGVVFLAEPLLHNPQLHVQVAESRSVRQSLILAEVTRVGDLLDYDRGDWLDPLTLAQRMGLSRPCTPRHILQEAKATLPPTAQAYLDRVLLEGMSSTPGPPDLLIGPLPRRPNRPPHPFTASRLHELQLVRFQTAPRKHLYMFVLHTLHALTLVSHPNTKWRDLLPPLEGEQPRWASLYSTLVPRPVGDIRWRLLHRAVSTGTYLAHPRYLSLLWCEGNPGARIFGVRQSAAPVPAPHKSPIMFLVAFFPSPFYLCTPHPWPHKVAGSPS